MRIRILACLAVLFAAVPAFAQKRVIVRGSAAKVARFAAKNGLPILRQADVSDQVLALLGGAPASLSSELAHGRSVQTDDVVLEFDRTVSIPELQSAVSLNQSTVAILDGLKNRSLSGYFGGQAWASYLNQAAGRIIRLPEARNLATGGGIVAVIDTGVDPNHPALAGALMTGYDFTRNQFGATEMADLQQSTVAILDGSAVSLQNKNAAIVNQSTVAILDQSTVAILDKLKLPASFGHGTMVASLVRLVAPTARILPLKAFAADGTANLFDIIRAIYAASLAGADVVNMSFSMDESSKELERAIGFAALRRTICVASAGNSGSEVEVYPGAVKRVAAVGSTSNTDTRSTFSNYGAWVSLAAPGEGLIAAWPGRNWAAASGTSFSTALVSGAVALLVQLDPRIRQVQIDAALSEAQPCGSELGEGRLDLFRACTYAIRH